MPRFVFLPERGNKNNSFPHVGIELTTVVYTVSRCVAVPRQIQLINLGEFKVLVRALLLKIIFILLLNKYSKNKGIDLILTRLCDYNYFYIFIVETQNAEWRGRRILSCHPCHLSSVNPTLR